MRIPQQAYRPPNLWCLGVCLAFIVGSGGDLARAAVPPNVVVIFIDDMGYGDIGPFGAKRPTPHLDRMAREGMKLTDFYVSSSACTPSRAALLTGCYANRIGMGKSVVFPADKRGLNPSETTLAEVLKAGGYATGCFGKWHLGDQPEFLPTRQGFDEYQGIPYSNDMWVKGNPKRKYPPLPWMQGETAVAHIPDQASQAEITDAITDATVEFIKRHKDQPFFAYVPHAAVHAPHMVTPERLAAANDDVMTALITEIDNSVGRILQALREEGLAENTFVLFTNDNGGAGKTSPGPLRGAKFGPKYEGHMRVATLAWWPTKIAGGSVSSEIMTTTDLLPTVARMTGQAVPEDRIIDGKDVSDILFGKSGVKSPHASLFYENDGIRQGRWKLVSYRVKADRFNELYDLETDLGERRNVAAQHPERVEAMKAALDAHVNEIEQNSRPAGFVDEARSLLADDNGLPTLAEYRNKAPNPAPHERIQTPAKAPAKQSSSQNTKRPDILFIAIDDMNDWTTLFDKNNPIQTPNLQRLAARGTFFDHAYCASPGCNPSRTAIMTGLRPTTSGVYSNGQAWRDKIPNAISLPEYLANHGGYMTRGAGKIYHHGRTGAEPQNRPSFQQFFNKLGIRGPGKNKNYNGYRLEDKTPLANLAFDWGVHDQKMIDVDMCEWVEARMGDERAQPMFLAAGIFNPHLPFYADAATFARYPREKVVLPPMPSDDLEDVGQVGIRMTDKESFVYDQTTAADPNSNKSLHRMVQCYQAAADYADQMVGRLLDKLAATGRDKNTIIVLWSDHGYHLGDKQCGVKFTLWEKANHVPFIIVAPGVAKPGTVCSAPVSLVDIYPTLVELAGLPPKADNDGQSLVPLLRDPQRSWSRPALMTEGPGNHAVRSRDFRYIRYHNGFEELYADDDPWNHNNLATESSYASVLAEHRRHLPQREAPGIPSRHQTANDEAWQTARTPKTRQPLTQARQPSDTKPGPRPAPRPRPPRIDVQPEVYKPAAGDILIADFEGDDYGNWQVHGEAMGQAPARAETHKNRIHGFLGQGFVNSYLAGDKKTGELISRPIKIERKYINLLIGGGRHAERTGVLVRVEGKMVCFATGWSMKNTKNEEVLDWQAMDVSAHIGKNAVLEIIDRHSGGWGHTVVDHIFQSDRAMTASIPAKLPATKPTATASVTSTASKSPNSPQEPVVNRRPTSAGFVPPAKSGVELQDEWATFPLYDAVGYNQSLRPQFHFSSRMGWLNDPNGMVYYDGEWHMLFQHHAKGNATGAKSWGNAVSTDLVHWQQLPHAINPYPNVKRKDGNIHAIWSGSAVVDEINALGKQRGDVKTLYAIYTATHSGADGKSAFFQGAAYSTDKGRTWTKINEGRPIIDHQEGYAGGQRDPRIFYYAPGKYYVVIMMVGGPERAVRLWKSTDLLQWDVLGDIPNKAAECIDMYQVAVDGDRTKSKWVIADAATRYEVGDFDGSQWQGSSAPDSDGRALRFDYGDAFYAAQAFNQAPDGRVVHVGWLRSKQPGYRPFLEANMPFTQQMSIPTEITLRTTDAGIRMYRNPVEEIKLLYANSTELNDLPATTINARLAELEPELLDLTLQVTADEDFALNVRGLMIHYDAAKAIFHFTNTARVAGEKAGMARLPKARQRRYRDDGRREIPAPASAGKVTLRVLVDRASLELFVNDGQAAASFVVVPDASNRRIEIQGERDLAIESFVLHELNSAWSPAASAKQKLPR